MTKRKSRCGVGLVDLPRNNPADVGQGQEDSEAGSPFAVWGAVTRQPSTSHSEPPKLLVTLFSPAGILPVPVGWGRGLFIHVASSAQETSRGNEICGEILHRRWYFTNKYGVACDSKRRTDHEREEPSFVSIRLLLSVSPMLVVPAQGVRTSQTDARARAMLALTSTAPTAYTIAPHMLTGITKYWACTREKWNPSLIIIGRNVPKPRRTQLILVDYTTSCASGFKVESCSDWSPHSPYKIVTTAICMTPCSQLLTSLAASLMSCLP